MTLLDGSGKPIEVVDGRSEAAIVCEKLSRTGAVAACVIVWDVKTGNVECEYLGPDGEQGNLLATVLRDYKSLRRAGKR